MIATARVILDILFAGIWQGACIAGVAAAIVTFAGRRLNAATRCALFQLGLFAIAVIPVATTLPRLISGGVSIGGFGVLSNANVAAGTRDPKPWSLHGIAIALDDRVVLALAALWAIGVVVFSLRLLGGSLQLARLLRRSTRLEDRGGVALYESHEIGIPLAFGLRSPAIVVPSVLARERGDEFDCIVLHELAHVRRSDAWMHLCERAIQALLYVNPAVAFLLGSISLEREAACDDWACEQTHEIDLYTRTLASFALWGVNARPVSPCAASGFGRATLARITRLEDRRRNGATTLSRLTLGGCTIVLFLFALTFQSFAPAIALEPQRSVPAVVAVLDCKDTPVSYLDGPAPTGPNQRGLRTVLKLQVSATGKVVLAKLYRPSGDDEFDHSVTSAAMRSHFTPATHACKPVPGNYMFLAQTAPN